MTNGVRANVVIEMLIAQFAQELAKEFSRENLSYDVLSYRGPIAHPIDEKIKEVLEGPKERNDNLIFVLETPGGYLDVVVRIVDTLRHLYRGRVEFLIPNYALSAGTVLALSGDEIWMDYFSVLGPIDPQEETADGKLIPALGYVERFDELIKKADKGKITNAEIALVVQGFDQGRLQSYKHQLELAKGLLIDWLPKYKFKNWNQTETRKKAVSHKMKKDAAKKIANALGDTKKWHVHARGINRDVLEHAVKLKTKDFGSMPDLNTKVRNYHVLLTDYAEKMGYPTFLYSPNRLIPFRFQ